MYLHNNMNKIRNKLCLIFLLLIVVLPIVYSASPTCDPATICTVNPQDYYALNGKYDALLGDYAQLNTSYYLVLNDYYLMNKTLNSKIDGLTNNLNDVTKERDYYKDQYENGSLGKISVKDFYMNIDKLIYTVNQNISQHVDAKFQNIEYKINNFYFYFILAFVIDIAVISFALWKVKAKLEAKIHNIKETNTTEINTTIQNHEQKNAKSKE